MLNPAMFRSAVDRIAPGAARWYRQRRDRSRDYPALPTPWGFTLMGDLGLAQSRVDSHEADLFLEHLPKTDLVVDIGANVGLFTLLAASKGVPVVAVEPSPLNLDVLYRNLRANDMTAEVLPVALADGPGLADLYGAGQGASLRPGWAQVGSTFTTTVPTHSLDGLMADRAQGKRLFIKIDAEGFELPILRGAGRLMREVTPAPTWVVEIGLTENFAEGQNPDFADIFELFWAAGYTARCVQAPGQVVTPEDVRRWVSTGDRGFWNIDYVFSKD